MLIRDDNGHRLLLSSQVADLLDIPRPAIKRERGRGNFIEPAGWIDERTPVWLEADVVASRIPQEMRDQKRWVLLDEPRLDRPATWAVHDAIKFQPPPWGYLIGDNDRLTCHTRPGCLIDGEPDQDTEAFLLALRKRIGKTYIEAAGNDLNIWGWATEPSGTAPRLVAVTARPFRSAWPRLRDLPVNLTQSESPETGRTGPE